MFARKQVRQTISAEDKIIDYGLLFYFSDDFEESDVAGLRKQIAVLASNGNWVGQSPAFVDETDSSGMNLSENDEPIRTVGGFLRITPVAAVVNRQMEKAHFEEVERIVKFLSAISADSGCEFELELGGTYVGSIENGVPDKLVAIGLLEEWRKRL